MNRANKIQSTFRKKSGHALAGSAFLVASAVASPLYAASIDTGNPDLDVRLDTTVRYNLGIRAEGVNDRFANSPTYDESELTFERGDVMLNRLDLLTELDFVYKGMHGFRVSASGWYDEAYEGKNPRVNPALAGTGGYIDNEYSGTTKRFHRGPSGEILDAFVFTNLYYGDSSLSAKAGQHTVFWGESLFNTFHGIAYSQAPLDGLKSASSPGITAKEVFMPVNQISANFEPSPELMFSAQYYLDWQPNRLPEGGTYFGSADMLWYGPDRMFLGFNGAGDPLFAPARSAYEPDDGPGNNFGLSVRWSPLSLEGTVGAYYRKFDETQAWGPVLSIDPATSAPTGYHLSYAEDTEMYALSFIRSIAGVSVGSELVYRHNTALVSDSSFAAAGDFAGREGARGDTLHFLVNGVWLMPRTPLWTGGTLQGELIYSHLLDVTKNEQVFKHEDYAGCPAGQDEGDGCATDDVVLMQIGFKPEWPQVLPGGGNLSMPVSVSYGIYGNGATVGGGNEGSYSWSVGLEANFRSKYLVSLKYNDAYARYADVNGVASTVSGNAVQNNHGWVSLAFQTSF